MYRYSTFVNFLHIFPPGLPLLSLWRSAFFSREVAELSWLSCAGWLAGLLASWLGGGLKGGEAGEGGEEARSEESGEGVNRQSNNIG